MGRREEGASFHFDPCLALHPEGAVAEDLEEVGGWVGDRKIEENEAVRMRCWVLGLGGWVGR